MTARGERAVRTAALSVAGLAAMFAAGCASGPRVAPPPAPDASDIAPSAPAPTDPSGSTGSTDAIPDRPLTLRECVEQAFRRRGSLRIADRRVLIARTRTDEAIGAVLPRLALDIRGESRNNDRGAQFPGKDPQVTGDRGVVTGNLSLIVPAYDFGGSHGRIDAADARAEATVLDARRARQDLALDVTRTYLRVLEARKILDVVDESTRVVERQLAVARDFEGAGLVARSDVLTAEVQLARRRQERIEARNNVELAVVTLNRMIGADVGRRTDVVDVLEASAWTGPLGESLVAALAQRPDLESLRGLVEAARCDVRASVAEYKPGVYAFVTADQTTDSYTLHKRWATAGLGLKWSLFDGWASDARNRRAALQVRDAEEARDELAADVALDVRVAYQDVQEAAERIPVARQAILLGEENLRVVRDQYGAGLVTSADLLAEEERLASSRSAYFRAMYGYQDAVARLGHAVGADPLGGDGENR